MTGEVSAIGEYGATSGVGVLASYAYNDLGRMTSIARDNGTVTSMGYDPASRLTSLAHDVAGAGYDVTTTFGYTTASQLASAARNNQAYAFTDYYYAPRSYTVNGLNQYLTSGGTTLGYDGRGNLTVSGSTNFAYTAENRLKTSSAGVSLYYDAVGRILEYDTSVSTRFVHDGRHLASEVSNPSGAILRRYVFGPGEDAPVTWYEGSGTADRRWLHADERGSVVAQSDVSGAVTQVYTYDEYGIPGAVSGGYNSGAGRFRYTGQVWLPELGLYYYKARMYSASLGRFMQTDPIGYGDGMNMYAYVQNDPLNKFDPTGLGNCPKILAPDESCVEGRLPKPKRHCIISCGFEHFFGFGPEEEDYAAQRYSSFTPITILPEPQKTHNQCGGRYRTVSFGGSVTAALFAGVNISASIGTTTPIDGGANRPQLFFSLQISGMLGVGGFLGYGATGSVGTNQGAMKSIDRGGFAYGEGDVGAGFALGASGQANASSSSATGGLPVPKVGAGAGAYAGVGVGYGVTAATGGCR